MEQHLSPSPRLPIQTHDSLVTVQYDFAVLHNALKAVSWALYPVA